MSTPTPLEVNSTTLNDNNMKSPQFKEQNQQKKPFETPSQTMNLKLTESARTARKEEVRYSENGSPLKKSEVGDFLVTSSKKYGDNIKTMFEFNVGGGKHVRIEKPEDLDALDEISKKEVMGCMIDLYKQCDNFVKNAKY